MKVLALHEDLIVFISSVWQTTCTAVRAGEEGFLIDSPVYPDELSALPGVLEQAGFPVSALLTTHADWDHLLGRLAFPGAALGGAESTIQRMTREPGEAQRKLRRFDEEHYVSGRTPLSLGSLQPLPVPGKLSLGQQELELHPAAGHTADGVAYRLPWLSTLVCGDYLSPVEIPMLSATGSVDAYLETLEQLRPVVEGCDTVIPGHGEPQPREATLKVLTEDVEYLAALAGAGADREALEQVELPGGRRSATQRQIHVENVARLTAVL